MGWFTRLVKNWPMVLYVIASLGLAVILYLAYHSVFVLIGALLISAAYGSLFFWEYSLAHTDDDLDVDDNHNGSS